MPSYKQTEKMQNCYKAMCFDSSENKQILHFIEKYYNFVV